ncbi:class I SAM-dependent methyltransferase [Aspergillus undulatus]|uniref:class I SAM-dependent methyltransferase n=1 Tax=Aspergillus undulatus TaxID=1810928 RepID=UPI003CCD5836
MTTDPESKDPVPTLTEAVELYNDTSAFYDKYSGDTTRSIARFMLSLPSSPTLTQSLGPGTENEGIILDNACGTGALTFELLLSFPQNIKKMIEIHATDIAPSMITTLLTKRAAEYKHIHSEIQLHATPMDSQNLSFPENSFTHVYMNFGIFFLPDPVRGVEEIYRTLKPGGHAYISTWKDLGYLDTLREAQRVVRPDSANSGEGGVFFSQLYSEEWFTESKLRNTLIAGGFDESRTEILRTRTRLTGMNVEGLIETFLVPYSKRMDDAGWTAGERERLRAVIRGLLTEEQKNSASVEMEAFVGVAVK